MLTFNDMLSENADESNNFKEAMERFLKNATEGLTNVKTAREALLKVADVALWSYWSWSSASGSPKPSFIDNCSKLGSYIFNSIKRSSALDKNK